MLSSHARRQAQAQSQVAFKLQFIGTVCESCARSFTYVPHMGIRHFTFVFKESPSERPLLHSSLSYPTWPAAQATLVPSCQLSLGLFRSSSWFRFRIRFLFFRGFFFFSDSTAFVVDDDKDRNRMTRSCSPKQAPVTQFSGLFQPAALTPLAK